MAKSTSFLKLSDILWTNRLRSGKEATGITCVRETWRTFMQNKKIIITRCYKHLLEQEANFSRERGYLAREQLDFTTY